MSELQLYLLACGAVFVALVWAYNVWQERKASRKAEEASVRDLFRRPLHPYTRGLLASVPKLGASLSPERLPRLAEISGTVPSLREEIPGCLFAERCAFATGICHREMPAFEEKEAGHHAACFHSEQLMRA